jgi:hypothetical protein
MTDDEKTAFFIGIICGLLAGLFLSVIIMIVTLNNTITINKEVANDVCFNLTKIKGVVASANDNYKLICETPSFDSTTNIIIKKAEEEK